MLERMQDAAVPLEVVIVSAHHAGLGDVPRLKKEHGPAVRQLVGAFEDAALNVITYGRTLHTYRPFEGMERVMSRFDENLAACEIERRKLRNAAARQAAEGAEEGDEDAEPPQPPCGLLKGQGGSIRGALDGLAFRGRHARLFAIDRDGLNKCVDRLSGSTALHHVDMDQLEQRTVDAGAFEEAVRLLVQYGTPGARKAIVVIGGGRDGYMDEDVECRRLYTSEDKFCAKKGEGLKGRQARKAIRECVQKWLDLRSTIVQQRFYQRATNWLALLRAADIKVHAVAYNFIKESDESPLSYEYERERLEVLALKTGGTYREVFDTKNIYDAVEAVGDEIRGEWVLTLPNYLKPETEYDLELFARVTVAGKSRPVKSLLRYSFTSPFWDHGLWYRLKVLNAQLKEQVGSVLYWIIVVLAALLLLVLLYLFFKLVKALVMKIVKAFAKKGKDAVGGN